MEINSKNKFTALLSGLLLPEYVFSSKFKHHYMFTDLMINNYCETQFVFELFQSLLKESMNNNLIIAQVDYDNRLIINETKVELVNFSIIRNVLNGNLNMQENVNYISPCNMPTIFYDDSLTWCLYYLYESEMVLLGNNSEIKLPAKLIKECSLESLREYFEYVGGIDYLKSEFQKGFIKNYGELIKSESYFDN